MDNGRQGSDRVGRATPEGSPSGWRPAPDAGPDPYGDIGYEAADPSLQLSLRFDGEPGESTQWSRQ